MPAGNTGALGHDVSLDVALVATSEVHDKLGDHGSPVSIELGQDRANTTRDQGRVAIAHPLGPAVVEPMRTVVAEHHSGELVHMVFLGLEREQPMFSLGILLHDLV